MNGTTGVHTSASSGSMVKFAFNGTFVAVYGVIDGDAVTASFKLDDQDPVTQGVPQPSNGVLRPNWPFYWTPLPINPDLHELTITVKQGTFNLDYITYTTLDDSNDSTGNPKVQVTSSSDAALPSSSPSRQLHPGAIAGIVVGAVLFLVAVVVAVVFVRRRSARRVWHRKLDSEKPIDIIYENAPKSPPVAAHRSRFRRFSRVYRPAPARSVQSSKTATSSAPTSITQSSAMFTSVIMLSPALSMVSEEDYGHNIV